MPKIIHTLAPFQPQALRVGSPTPRRTGKQMKASLLFGLSGLRSAALPLPLGVFRPSERYWWPLSPSSSLRFACSQKERQLSVAPSVLLFSCSIPLRGLSCPTVLLRRPTQRTNSVPTLGGLNKVILRLWLHHLSTVSMYVLGTGLVAKNISCTMERKFTLVGTPPSDLVGYLHLLVFPRYWLYLLIS